MTRQLFIHVAPTLPKSKLHYEDKEVGGVYLVEVGVDQDESLPAKEREELAVSAALNEFHDTIAIKVLDDFAIGVKNQAGRWVGESDQQPDEDELPSADICGCTGDTPEDCTKPAPKPKKARSLR